MDTQDSLNSEPKGFLELITKNWGNLDQTQKTTLTKIWKVLTYKWHLQILFNTPFLIWWVLDKSISHVHEFDVSMLNYLNLPDWALSFLGFGQQLS